ncbi:phosphoribosyl-ATP diphosphatase [Pacificispira sp.]|uniref:phosphoribosyl-ATP diphosphatase n=1 Tax=Pacificispira sp. TaxID=2888761 RepID=UPI002EADD0EC|nr:phosphoribosyl-ATP diphosphatase [Pseudomonadota bacterium]
MSEIDATVLDRLYNTVATRKGADPDTSYTAKLFGKGRGKIAQKLGEESVETVIEAMKDDREGIASESADLLYHLMVLWADAGLKPDEVWAKLAAREGTSGLTEKASRKQD